LCLDEAKAKFAEMWREWLALQSPAVELGGAEGADAEN
jgi:hypothetical protein